MGRDERKLPLEYNGALSFPELLDTLDSLSGERVTLHVTMAQVVRGIARSAVDAVGTLERVRTPSTDGAVYQVGPDTQVTLKEGDIVSARLTTLEGNFYFQVTVELGALTVGIADEELQGLGRFD